MRDQEGETQLNHHLRDEQGWDDNESSDLAGIRKLFEHELSVIYAVEWTMIEVWPNVIKYASSPALVEQLREYFKDRYQHVVRLQEIQALLGKELTGKQSLTVNHTIQESKELIRQLRTGLARDAAIILVAKKLAHYEISIYEALYTYALVLGEQKVAFMLNQNMQDEKENDLHLTAISTSFIGLI